ncbi:LysR substrate-binding domain-containing protein [Variovorax defluvii]
MELRQLRYFVNVVDAGSMNRAALQLDMVQSALSQQISRLESELCTRLLQRSPQGILPTEAGIAFYHQAKLTLRCAEQARIAAQEARLSGSVSVGLAPSTARVLGLPMMRAMRQRYPDVKLHMVESMSGHLGSMLRRRELDLAVLFDHASLHSHQPRGGKVRWQVEPLVRERLFFIRTAQAAPLPDTVSIAEVAAEPLVLPSSSHGLRSAIDAAFTRARLAPRIELEVDSLAMVMDAVDAGIGATLQPWAALGRHDDQQARFCWATLEDPDACRVNVLCSASDDEVSPAVLAARNIVRECVQELVASGRWLGTEAVTAG